MFVNRFTCYVYRLTYINLLQLSGNLTMIPESCNNELLTEVRSFRSPQNTASESPSENRGSIGCNSLRSSPEHGLLSDRL